MPLVNLLLEVRLLLALNQVLFFSGPHSHGAQSSVAFLLLESLKGNQECRPNPSS
jgi:hypothetical protein